MENIYVYTGWGTRIDTPSTKNFHPTKMTQNDMKCHFESFFGVEIFGRGVSILVPHPVN